MLQPMLVRPLFRVLAVPLGLLILASGCGIILVSIAALTTPLWWFLMFSAVGLAVATIGVLCLILAATGALPEWVVGNAAELEDPPTAP